MNSYFHLSFYYLRYTLTIQKVRTRPEAKASTVYPNYHWHSDPSFMTFKKTILAFCYFWRINVQGKAIDLASHHLPV